MSITSEQVRTIFAGMEHGDGAALFAYVADDVDWTVHGTQPLAGHYRSKADFRAGTFAKLAKVLPAGTQLRVTNVLISGDWAIVELKSAATAVNGMKFANDYCWITRFAGETIVEVRAYLDSTLVQRLFDENPIDG